ASHGSTSLSGKLKFAPGKLPSLAPPQPGANGVGMLISTGAVTVSGAAVAAGSGISARAATPITNGRMRRILGSFRDAFLLPRIGHARNARRRIFTLPARLGAPARRFYSRADC